MAILAEKAAQVQGLRPARLNFGQRGHPGLEPGIAGTLGVSDYRYFNRRDNRSSGTDLFDAVGLLRDAYTEKPAFSGYRSLVEQHGEAAP